MATDFIAGDVVMFTAFCHTGNQLGVNTYWYRVVAASSPAPDTQQILDAWSTIAAGAYKPIISTAHKYYGARVDWPWRVDEPVGVTSAVGQGFGTDANDPLPEQVSGIITKKTLRRGKSGRGRVYIPFPTEGQSDQTLGDTRPTVAYITALGPFVNIITGSIALADGGGRTVTLVGVIAHRADKTTTDISDVIIQRKWATQKRRGDYGRVNALPF